MSAERRWLAIQHVSFEGPGSIATEAAQRGTPLHVCAPHRGEQLPPAHAVDGLVVMGGPMGVSDTAAHPYLLAELELIAALVAAGRPVLGVCLGAQLLAAALGARVYRGAQAELGPGTVSLTDAGCADPVLGAAAGTVAGAPAGVAAETAAGTPAGELPVVHWHQDTFELPPGATHLAYSALYPNQAFRVGACAYGLQFHIELDRALAASWRTQLPAGVELGESVQLAVERVGRRAIAAFFDLLAPA